MPISFDDTISLEIRNAFSGKMSKVFDNKQGHFENQAEKIPVQPPSRKDGISYLSFSFAYFCFFKDVVSDK